MWDLASWECFMNSWAAFALTDGIVGAPDSGGARASVVGGPAAFAYGAGFQWWKQTSASEEAGNLTRGFESELAG